MAYNLHSDRSIRKVAWALMILAQVLRAQSPLEFDAISIKPYDGPIKPGELSANLIAATSLKGGPGTADPARITANGITLQRLIASAYGVLDDQVSGPGWITGAQYTLEARVPPGVVKEQADRMLQQALAERFKLTLHHEQRRFQVWELVTAKDALKLKESADQNAQPQMNTTVTDGVRHDMYRAFHVSKTDPNDAGPSLDTILSLYLTATGMVPAGTLPSVVDKTGLTRKYDFDLEYLSPAFRDRADAGGPTLFGALEKLGLKLDQEKASLDVLVIDRAEKVPAQN